ncbi:hypothetical protein DEO72_LG1g3149 [Vigna unguiculata]|uniref:Uncharacterized protein n=1 Tax=Vigna unguiculata TaxID=3917 RepID=A0A4D6KUF8_VIGUN|nr:hypothetical protein DEO72_LG1g3149 [Vigna unguiculata]
MSRQITSPVIKEEDEETKEVVQEKEEGTKEVVQQKEEDASHPYAFHVSGPRNLTNLNWRDLISSSWWVYPFHVFI